MAKKTTLPGCLYQRNGRWYWKVQLPGEPKFKMRPLVPKGGCFATKDRGVAEQIAREMFVHAAIKSNPSIISFDGSIASLVAKYLVFARGYYIGAKDAHSCECDNIKTAVQPLLAICGNSRAEDFGPLLLQEVRQIWIEKGLCRTTINQRTGIIKRLFKWASAQQMIPASMFYGLQAVEGLRHGRTAAKESKKVPAVPETFVRRILPFACPTVAAMIELQMLTGMRSGELCRMRPCDMDTSGAIWRYVPQRHKTQHHDIHRIIPIGPRGQKILKPFMDREPDKYCFSPRESMAQRFLERSSTRTTPLSCGNKPGTNTKSNPRSTPGDYYDPNCYRSAVVYAIKAARKSGKFEENEIIDIHPHQLRHTTATIVRKEFGLDAARALLGHKSLAMTDGYAEIDKGLADRAAITLG
jgi:integrase